jgi:hypothetical protein
MTLSLTVAGGAVITCLVAAWYWYESTKPKVPAVVDDNDVMHAMAWFHGEKDAADKTAKANKKAAIWTAATVLLGAISTFLAASGSN